MATKREKPIEIPLIPEFRFWPELFKRLWWCSAIVLVVFIGCYLVVEDYIFPYLMRPLSDMPRSISGLCEPDPNFPHGCTLHFGIFFIYIRVCFVASIFICIPIITYHILKMVTKNRPVFGIVSFLSISFCYNVSAFFFVYFGLVSPIFFAQIHQS